MGNIRPFSALSSAERVELYRLAGNVRSCASCRAWLPSEVRIAGRTIVEMKCTQRMHAASWGGPCDFYEREAGAD